MGYAFVLCVKTVCNTIVICTKKIKYSKQFQQKCDFTQKTIAKFGENCV